MQTIHCEKCIASFTDNPNGELFKGMNEAALNHLNECEDCRKLYIAFVELSDLMHKAPAIENPKAGLFDVKSIIKAGKKQKAQKRIRQWTSVAAVFVVCAGSLLAFDEEIKDILNDESAPSMEIGIVSTMDGSGDSSKEAGSVKDTQDTAAQDLADDELQLKYGICERQFELFDQAMADSIFAASVENMDLGYGYEVVDYFQEEDGSTTFVLYFYEDEARTLITLEESADYLLLSNVRSFNWSKSEL